MKEFQYRISELAKLYGINSDSLRYYEKSGLLSPKRHKNGYRCYGISDICVLNIIRSLRGFGLSLEQIAQYVQGRSIATTICMVEKENALLYEKAKELEAAQRSNSIRQFRISSAMIEACETLTIKSIGERKCWYSAVPFIYEEEVDYYLNSMVACDGLSVHRLINTVATGSVAEYERIHTQASNIFSGVFLLSDRDDTYNYTIPAGEYASFLYRGRYRHPNSVLALIKDEVIERDYTFDTLLFQLYRVDEHDTGDVEEYVTEVQFKLKKAIAN